MTQSRLVARTCFCSLSATASARTFLHPAFQLLHRTLIPWLSCLSYGSRTQATCVPLLPMQVEAAERSHVGVMSTLET